MLLCLVNKALERVNELKRMDSFVQLIELLIKLIGQLI